MTKEELLGSICLADAINECCSEEANSDTSCEKCELEMSIMLDKFAKQIRAETINEFVSKVDEAITEMENNSKIEKTIHNACVVGAIVGTMKRIAKELKEQK